jgi:hypothetical protein
MEGEPTSLMMMFLLPFHLGGGAALGYAFRNILKDGFKLGKVGRYGFWLLWGSMFGGLPFVFGVILGSPWFFLFELVAFFGAMALVGLRYEWLRDLYSQPGMFVASFGFVFFLIGATLTTTLLSEGTLDALIPGLIFLLIGGLITASGVWLLLRPR